jgi:ribosome-binding protein aMBF1 (putative translation factor)
MARKTTSTNPHRGQTIEEFISEERSRDPRFAEEFDRLRLARRVKALREAKRLSQNQLAELTGTKQPAIARLESGRVMPRLDLLQKIAAAMGMRLDVRFVHSNKEQAAGSY